MGLFLGPVGEDPGLSLRLLSQEILIDFKTSTLFYNFTDIHAVEQNLFISLVSKYRYTVVATKAKFIDGFALKLIVSYVN